MADVVEVLCDEARELCRLGCTLQLERRIIRCSSTAVGGRSTRSAAGRWTAGCRGVELDNAVIEAGRSATFGFHPLPRRPAQQEAGRRRVRPDRRPGVGRVRPDRLLLEYDDERWGSFDPLRPVPDDKVGRVGLVTTKILPVESLDQLAARLREAESLVGSDRAALNPQCGFATSVAGNVITPEAQHGKLALLVRAAQELLPA